jgi:hypothetical protein
MGIDINGGIMVGKWGEDIKVPAKYEDLSEMCESEGLDYMSPWYDAGIVESFIGVYIKERKVTEIDLLVNDCKEAEKKLKDLLGEDLVIYGGQHVY